MANQDQGLLAKVQQYQSLVLHYEALDKVIDELLMAHGGASENLSPVEFERYRQLAWERDEVENEVRRLGQELQIGDEE